METQLIPTTPTQTNPNPAANETTIAFLGIGLMGARQARRLLRAGYRMNAWNRTVQKARELEADGARVAETAAEAVAGAQFVVTMLQDGPAVARVLLDPAVQHALTPGAIVVDTSSIRPAEARDHARQLAAHGVRYLDAPVSGGTAGAEQGTLAIMCGGDADVFERALPMLTCMGRPTLVGPHGSGQLTKLANQVIVGATIGAVAEALLLARRGGADPAKVIAALAGGFADSPILRLHGARMVERDYAPRGRSATHLKDLANAIDAANATGSPTPYAHLTAGLFDALLNHDGDVDHSGLMLELERRVSDAG